MFTDFVTKASNAPCFGGFVDSFNDAQVQIFSFPENAVQGDLSKFRSHRRLGQLSDGKLGIFNSIAGLKSQRRF